MWICVCVCVFCCGVPADHRPRRSSEREGGLSGTRVYVCFVHKCLSYLDVDLFHFVHDFIFVYVERERERSITCGRVLYTQHPNTKHDDRNAWQRLIIIGARLQLWVADTLTFDAAMPFTKLLWDWGLCAPIPLSTSSTIERSPWQLPFIQMILSGLT